MFESVNWNIRKSTDKPSWSMLSVVLFSALLLTSCGGGDDFGGGGTFGLDGGPVTDSASSTSATSYNFDVVAGTPYTIALVNISGETGIYAYKYDPYSVSQPSPFAISWTDGSYEAVSFIASSSETIYVLAIAFDENTTYTIEASTNHLPVGAAARTDAVYGSGGTFSSDLYYSFDAQIDNSYEVRVAPTQGDVNLTAVTLNADMTGSIGSSSNTGTAIDSVFFTATATQRYYIKVDGTNVDSVFGVQVLQVPAGPELSVVIDSAVSDGTNVIVDYTVYNNGADAYSGDIQVDAWANSATAPGVGLTGDDFVTHTAISIAGLGGTISGTATIANTAENGTAYVVVDTIEAVVESNESNNISTAISWQKPLIAPVSIDFEDGTIPAKVVMSGDANWLIDSTTGGSGSFKSLRSGVIGNNDKSCFAISVYNSRSAEISFDRSVSSEWWDKLSFYIDGAQKDTWEGASVAWGNVAYGVSIGLHVYKWCYTKDFTGISGTDEAWVDNISIDEIPSDLSVVVTSPTWDGANVTLNYTVYNNSGVTSDNFNVDFWSAATHAPVLGDAGETIVSHTGLAPSSSVAGSVTIPNTSATGLSYAIVDTAGVVFETNTANNISSGVSFITVAPELSVEVTGAWSDGTDVIIDYTVTNNNNYAAAAFAVEFLSDSVSLPVVGDLMDAMVSYPDLAANTSVSDTVTIANTAATGTAYAIVDNSDSLFEIDESNNVSNGVVWDISPTAPLVYDFEDSSLPSTFKMSGDANWMIATEGVGQAQTIAIRSGVILDSQESCAKITVIGSSSVTFDYIVSASSTGIVGDRLRFYVDGISKLVLHDSGTTDWTNVTHNVTTGLGIHDYEWCYTKDDSLSSNDDAAWIDNINFN